MWTFVLLSLFSFLDDFEEKLCAPKIENTMYRLGIQIRNMKMVFNIYGTWRWVMFVKLMMKIYDFFYSAKSFSHPV